jgi:glycosyltransferase involved in cell wall biosynthesis
MTLNSTKPLFSVIIAAYNSSKTLSRAIDSVLSQSYSNFEIILVDDGSDDNTSDIVKQFGNKVRYFYQKNSGVSSARNAGAAMASGQWLSFLDADDWYYPQRLEHFAQILNEAPYIDFIIGDYHYGYSHGEIIKRSIEDFDFGKNLLATSNKNGFNFLDSTALGQVIPYYFGHTSTFSLPKSTFDSLGGYSRKFSIGEDLHLLIRLCMQSQTAGVACEPTSFYCVHEQGLMRSNKLDAQYQVIEMLLSLKDELKNAPKPIIDGFKVLLNNARYDLSVVLLKQGFHFKALSTYFSAIFETPSLLTCKRWLSLVRG